MVLNAALIAAAQAVEHYEITRYGTLVAWAKALGRDDIAKLFDMPTSRRRRRPTRSSTARQAQDQPQGRRAQS